MREEQERLKNRQAELERLRQQQLKANQHNREYDDYLDDMNGFDDFGTSRTPNETSKSTNMHVTNTITGTGTTSVTTHQNHLDIPSSLNNKINNKNDGGMTTLRSIDLNNPSSTSRMNNNNNTNKFTE